MGILHTKISDGNKSIKIRGGKKNAKEYIYSLAFEFENLNKFGSKCDILNWFECNFPNVSKKEDMYVHIIQPKVIIRNIFCTKNEKTTLFCFHLYDKRSKINYLKSIPLIYK